jgi:hypothetical protein
MRNRVIRISTTTFTLLFVVIFSTASQTVAMAASRPAAMLGTIYKSCSSSDRSDCRTSGTIEEMVMCERNMSRPEDLIHQWWGQYVLSCESWIHIWHNHFPADATDRDRMDFAVCVGAALSVQYGRPWNNARYPNHGYAYRNPDTDTWGYVVVGDKGLVTTAYTSGDGRDWGGCARHLY